MAVFYQYFTKRVRFVERGVFVLCIPYTFIYYSPASLLGSAPKYIKLMLQCHHIIIANSRPLALQPRSWGAQNLGRLQREEPLQCWQWCYFHRHQIASHH